MIAPAYTYRAVIVSVYDGDTVRADIDLGLGIWCRGQTLRLYGIDAPELRGGERIDGLATRDALRELILDRDVILRTHKDARGKYGRWLADIYRNGVHVNQYLINAGLAVPYT